jgi:hypothetical protein
MNCAEFHEVLPEIVDGGRTADQESHLKSCSSCSELLAELNTITEMASQLRATDEPSPRVWNSIEIALRKEGLIRQPQREPRLAIVPSAQRWNLSSWLVPVAAAVLLLVGISIYLRRPAPSQVVSENNKAPAQQVNISASDPEDQQMLEIVSTRVPGMKAAYEHNLRQVNAYIRDAEDSLKTNPDDEEAQQAVMTAYEQKSVVYQMAMDRSLP